MRRTVLLLAMLALACAAPTSAETRTYFGFQIGVSNAPPPPAVVFEREPRVVMIPSTRVYMVDDDDVDCDMFQYGRYWYACDDGYWYRARSCEGPFRVVDVRYVPRQIFYVPEKHWKHRHGHHDRGHGWGRERREVVVVRTEERHKHKHGHHHDDDD
jgi:hypothetical protein